MKKFIKHFFVDMDEINVYLILVLLLTTFTAISTIITNWTN